MSGSDLFICVLLAIVVTFGVTCLVIGLVKMLIGMHRCWQRQIITEGRIIRWNREKIYDATQWTTLFVPVVEFFDCDSIKRTFVGIKRREHTNNPFVFVEFDPDNPENACIVEDSNLISYQVILLILFGAAFAYVGIQLGMNKFGL